MYLLQRFFHVFSQWTSAGQLPAIRPSLYLRQATGMAKIRRLHEDFSVVATLDVKVVMPLNIDRCPNVVKAIHCSFTFLDMLQLLNNVAVTFCWRVFVFSMDSGPCPPKPDQFEPKLLWNVAVTPSFCILCASWTPQFPSISWKFLGTPASAMECNEMSCMYVMCVSMYV